MTKEGNENKPRLSVFPCELSEANYFVKKHHRHHGKVIGHKFSLMIVDEAEMVRGVAIVGRPVNTTLDNGLTLEVNRVATDGCPNACSALYGAAWRAAKALGYRKLITYTLNTEPGNSLRGAGWTCVAEIKGRSWNRLSRPRIDKHPLQNKFRWEVSSDVVDTEVLRTVKTQCGDFDDCSNREATSLYPW